MNDDFYFVVALTHSQIVHQILPTDYCHNYEVRQQEDSPDNRPGEKQTENSEGRKTRLGVRNLLN